MLRLIVVDFALKSIQHQSRRVFGHFGLDRAQIVELSMISLSRTACSLAAGSLSKFLAVCLSCHKARIHFFLSVSSRRYLLLARPRAGSQAVPAKRFGDQKLLVQLTESHLLVHQGDTHVDILFLEMFFPPGPTVRAVLSCW